MTGDFLPYARQVISEDDIHRVVEVLRSPYLTSGPAVEAFEWAFAAKVGVRYALATNSGTAALHLALAGLGVGEGENGIVPAVTFVSTANVLRHLGAEVSFTDVSPVTGLMELDHFETALANIDDGSARVVMPVHLAGQTADMEAIQKKADEVGLLVVEDACHALGTQYKIAEGNSSPVGSCQHSHACAFSLHAIKTVTAGEGGVVTTNDKNLYERMKMLRSHGMTRDPETFSDTDGAFDEKDRLNPWYYEMHDPGWNYRLSDIQCGLALGQLERLDAFVAHRAGLVASYRDALSSLKEIVRPMPQTMNGSPAWHLFVALIDFVRAGVSRAVVMERLQKAGIGSQVHYRPVSEQPYYRARYGVSRLAGAAEYYDHALSLPLHCAMSESDVGRVVSALENAFERRLADD